MPSSRRWLVLGCHSSTLNVWRPVKIDGAAAAAAAVECRRPWHLVCQEGRPSSTLYYQHCDCMTHFFFLRWDEGALCCFPNSSRLRTGLHGCRQFFCLIVGHTKPRPPANSWDWFGGRRFFPLLGQGRKQGRGSLASCDPERCVFLTLELVSFKLCSHLWNQLPERVLVPSRLLLSA